MTVLPDPERLSNQIRWQFTLTASEVTAPSIRRAVRYGTLAGEFYKQYLPSGVPLPKIYPPRKIPKTLYDVAENLHQSLPPAL